MQFKRRLCGDQIKVKNKQTKYKFAEFFAVQMAQQQVCLWNWHACLCVCDQNNWQRLYHIHNTHHYRQNRRVKLLPTAAFYPFFKNSESCVCVTRWISSIFLFCVFQRYIYRDTHRYVPRNDEKTVGLKFK